MPEQTTSITFRIQRFDPEKDKQLRIQEYSVLSKRGMTILEGLIYIKENLDSTLAFRTSCRMGICGSCGMFINNYPRLACQTQIAELKSTVITIKPLPNSPLIKDLAVDLSPLFEKHRSIKPFIVQNAREAQSQLTREYLQTPEQVEEYEQFSYCVKCGICLAACPTSASDVKFLGPQALGQTYRYCADNRDSGSAERLKIAESNHGAWRCHLAGACSEACPKGVDPGLAIQLLKNKMAKQALSGGKKEKTVALYPEPSEIKPKIPFPPFTAKKS
jgi:succinate dehydrogenase / fumarate reductase, iron-sulfur subunit